jgi:hypothetical protein
MKPCCSRRLLLAALAVSTSWCAPPRHPPLLVAAFSR